MQRLFAAIPLIYSNVFLCLSYAEVFVCLGLAIITVCRHIMHMELRTALMQKNMTAYRLSAISGVPYMTVNDLVNHVTPIGKARFATILALSKALGLSCEDLYEEEPYRLPDHPEWFTSSIQHRLKSLGTYSFMEEVLSTDSIGEYLKENRLFEARYLLALFDYLSRVLDLPLVKNYAVFRTYRFAKPVFLGSPLSEEMKEENLRNAIPEFMDANIVEGGPFDIA